MGTPTDPQLCSLHTKQGSIYCLISFFTLNKAVYRLYHSSPSFGSYFVRKYLCLLHISINFPNPPNSLLSVSGFFHNWTWAPHKSNCFRNTLTLSSGYEVTKTFLLVYNCSMNLSKIKYLRPAYISLILMCIIVMRQ